MRALAIVALFAAGCSTRRQVELELLDDGFACRERGSSSLLIERAISAGRLELSLIVDFIDLEGELPSCRGEQLAAWCVSHGGCEVLPLPGGVRYCQRIELDVAGMSSQQILGAAHAELAGRTVIEDAPDVPVLVRAVATTQTCDEVAAAIDGAFPDFAPDAVVGCAYSCPVLLDAADRVTLAIDTFDDDCAAQVLACAVGP